MAHTLEAARTERAERDKALREEMRRYRTRGDLLWKTPEGHLDAAAGLSAQAAHYLPNCFDPAYQDPEGTYRSRLFLLKAQWHLKRAQKLIDAREAHEPGKPYPLTSGSDHLLRLKRG